MSTDMSTPGVQQLDAEGAGADIDLWLSDNARRVQRRLLENGALLVRGLPVLGSKKLERTLTSLFDAPLIEYSYRSTPRTQMRGLIYTSSEYHPAETIPLHGENAYARTWPRLIAFHCVTLAESGGETPIADARKVYDAIPARIRDRFIEKKLMYVRNYGEVDLPWQEVFQTSDPRQVEEYCETNDIAYEWRENRTLRTRQMGDAVQLHPGTGENLWFNQAHLFHISALAPAARSTLQHVYRKEDLPRNVYHSDGADIEIDDLEAIRAAYQKNMITFQWREGDLLLLDNMLYSHGRLPYTGARRVLVGMAGEVSGNGIRCEEAQRTASA